MTTDVSTIFAFCCVQGFQDIRPRTSDGGESFYSPSVAVRMRYKFRPGGRILATRADLTVWPLTSPSSFLARREGLQEVIARRARGHRASSLRPSAVLAWSACAVTRSSRSARAFYLAPSSGMLQMELWRRIGPMGLFRRSVLLCRARSLHVASTCAGMPDARRRRLAATLSEPGRAMSSRRHVHPDMCEGALTHCGALHAYVHG